MAVRASVLAESVPGKIERKNVIPLFGQKRGQALERVGVVKPTVETENSSADPRGVGRAEPRGTKKERIWLIPQ